VSVLAARLRTHMQSLWEATDAEYRRRLLDALPLDVGARLLDVGCDDGEWTQAVADRLRAPAAEVAGIEVVEERRALALARGFDVRAGDLAVRWPFADGVFDVVHANQVIEHVHRLDHFVEEVARVLRPGGAAVICTENLAAWHNIGATVLGYMPFSLTNISRLGAVGNPLALHHGVPPTAPESWQHVHVLTLVALRSIFELHGFTIRHQFGAGYHPASGRLAERLATRDPRHAHFIGIVATSPGGGAAGAQRG
jgi:SAM-dependent methyltransferase